MRIRITLDITRKHQSEPETGEPYRDIDTGSMVEHAGDPEPDSPRIGFRAIEPDTD